MASPPPYKTGMGYDAHKLAPGRRLILGGVHIPYDRGMAGHSDADALLHAVIDAMLGAAALPDIGRQFPDTDECLRGADSITLLKLSRELLLEEGWRIANISAVIIAEAPKLSPFIDEMRANVARTLAIDITSVGISAKTEEGMGFTGFGEGIAARCVCLIYNI